MLEFSAVSAFQVKLARNCSRKQNVSKGKGSCIVKGLLRLQNLKEKKEQIAKALS
jgi:hypothetical protein